MFDLENYTNEMAFFAETWVKGCGYDCTCTDPTHDPTFIHRACLEIARCYKEEGCNV